MSFYALKNQSESPIMRYAKRAEQVHLDIKTFPVISCNENVKAVLNVYMICIVLHNNSSQLDNTPFDGLPMTIQNLKIRTEQDTSMVPNIL